MIQEIQVPEVKQVHEQEDRDSVISQRPFDLDLVPSAFPSHIQVPLKWTINMSPESRRFYSFQTLVYLQHFKLFLVKYSFSFLNQPTSDNQQNKQHVRITLPSIHGNTNLNKIQLISLAPQTLILVGFSTSFCLYRWTTGEFISNFTLPSSQEQILSIGTPQRISNNRTFLTINTTSQIYILKISYNKTIIVDFFLIPKPSSFIKSITSFFKTVRQPKFRSFTFSVPSSENLFSLVTNNNIWSLYRINSNEIRGNREWEREVFKLDNTSYVVDIKVKLEDDLVAYVLIRESENVRVLRIEIDITKGQTKQTSIQLQAKENHQYEINVQNYLLYLVDNDLKKKRGLLSIYESNTLQLINQQLIGCNIVLGDKIIITGLHIYEYTANNRRDKFGQIGHKDSYHSRDYQKVSHQNNNQQQVQMEVQEESIVSSCQRAQLITQQPFDHHRVKKTISQEIKQLQNRSKQLLNDKQTINCIKQLVLRHIQMDILKNLDQKIVHKFLIQYNNPKHTSQFFHNTKNVLDMLSAMSRSYIFQYFIDLIKLAYSKLTEYKRFVKYEKAHQQVSSNLFEILWNCINKVKQAERVDYHQIEELDKVIKIVGESSSKYFDYLLTNKQYVECYQYCLKNKYDQGIIKLYVQTDYLAAQQLKSYIQTQAQSDFISQLTIYYFQFLQSNRVPKLKLLIDLPEHISKIHKIVQVKFPKYTWITALGTKQYINYLRIKMRNIITSDSIDYKVMLSIQNGKDMNPSLAMKQKIGKVCEVLGWNCMPGEQLKTILDSKSGEERDQIVRKLEENEIDLKVLIKEIEEIGQYE